MLGPTAGETGVAQPQALLNSEGARPVPPPMRVLSPDRGWLPWDRLLSPPVTCSASLADNQQVHWRVWASARGLAGRHARGMGGHSRSGLWSPWPVVPRSPGSVRKAVARWVHERLLQGEDQCTLVAQEDYRSHPDPISPATVHAGIALRELHQLWEKCRQLPAGLRP